MERTRNENGSRRVRIRAAYHGASTSASREELNRVFGHYEVLRPALKINRVTSSLELRLVRQLPLGTVSYLLNDKKTFRRLDDGRWDVTDAVRNVGH